MLEEIGVAGGITSKVINDFVDRVRSVYKDTDIKRNAKHQNRQTGVYQIVEDALNVFTDGKYRGKDVLHDAAECILNGIRSEGIGHVKSIKPGLVMLGQPITDDVCEKFTEILCHEICKERNEEQRKEESFYLQMQGVQYGKDAVRKLNDVDGNVLDIKKDVASIKDTLNSKESNSAGEHREVYVRNRADEYAEKWDKNVFLNNFNKRDENAGVNIKLRELYPDEHMPHYVWKSGREQRSDLKELLREYTAENDTKRMLLILGHAGIGKSTLITWVAANFKEKKDDYLVYQFASDLEGADWKGSNIFDNILG